MRITALEVRDYKRIHTLRISPAADRTVILIGGENGAGKSSTLDALSAAFGGAKAVATDPVRRGAKEASIYVELDGGALTIDRVIGVDGKPQLEVRDGDGPVRSPQGRLDQLIGARFIDPLAFLALTPREQRAQMMKLIPEAERIADLDAKRARAFDRRTELGRDLTKAEGELARLPEEPAAAATIDVAAITAELRQLTDQQRAGDALVMAASEADRAAHASTQALAAQRQVVASAERQVAELEAALAHARQRVEVERGTLPAMQAAAEAATAALSEANAKVKAAAEAWSSSAPRRAALEAQAARADEHNRACYAAQARAERRAAADAEVEKLRADVAACATAIKTVDDRKAAILAAAKLPVEGLGLGDVGLTMADERGVVIPFEQASGAWRLRVALGLAVSASPGLDDVWIRDGALLDERSLELVAQFAASRGKRVWIERVGLGDPGAIVIVDGVYDDGGAPPAAP